MSPDPTAATSASDSALRAYLTEFYGKRLSRTSDLERQACCADDTMARFRDIVALLPDEVTERNYGCGSTVPLDDLSGLTVLDLGSGAGLDAFILSRLVGESGRVIGVDMTPEQLEVARRHAPAVARSFGFASSNVRFIEGYIETCDDVEDASIDLVVSDCVINLSPRKDRVFETIHRVLRPGGELYISDIVADRRVPEEIQHDRNLVAECLGGALYEHDLFDVLRDVGFGDPRIVSRRLVEEDVRGLPIRFHSITVRAFRLTRSFDRRCEDYGQVAFYRGNCAAQPARFALDDHHVFEAGRPVPVCRNTARMLSETRLSRYFEVTPERRHLGLFDCSSTSLEICESGGACC